MESERSHHCAIPAPHSSFMALLSFILSVLSYTVVVRVGNRVNASSIKDYTTIEI